jgi:hypothetical protein
MPVRRGNDWQQIRGRVVGTLEQEIPMTDYRELEDKARSIGSKWTLEVADAIKALREENERLKFVLDRWKLAESLDLECQCEPGKQVKTFTRNCGYVCGHCGKFIGLSDADLLPTVSK